MTRRRLRINYEINFLLFGISSHVKDYRLCGELNKTLDIDLVKVEDMELELGKDENDLGYSHYIYEDEDMHVKYKVLSNRGDTSWLVSEQRGVDYFLLIEGACEALDKAAILGKIKQAGVVLAGYELDPNQLKSKPNLLFE